MNFDSCQETADMRDKTAQEIELALPECMRYPVEDHGVKTGVTEDNLKDTPHRRIPLKDNLEIFF
jgi:hypothetical protein